MALNSGNQRAFQVVQFIELPFEGIDDYVCVPCTWLIRRKDQKAIVKYPKDEDPFDTRDRAERKERYNDEWGSYMAVVKYESDTYRDAEYWIATRNDYGPLVEKESKVIDTPPRFALNKKLGSAKQNHLSKSNDNFREPLPIISIKRPAQLESKKGIGEKRLKLGEAAQSSDAVVNGAREERLNFLTIIQDNQLMECAQAEQFNNIPDSLKMSAALRSHMLEGRRLIPIHPEPITIKNRVMQPISRNLVTAAQKPSNLIDQTRSLLSRSVEQPPVVTQNQSQNDPQVLKMHTENQYLRTNQGNFKQELLRGSIEGNSYDHRPTSRTIKMSITSNRKKITQVSNPMYQTSERPQQRQSLPNQQDSQRQPQRPKIRIGITIKRKDKRQNMPTLEEVTKKTQRQALSTTHNNLILSQQQLQPRLSVQSTEDNNIALTTSQQSNNSMQRETQPATQSSEERHAEVTASASSSNENQQSNDVSNKPSEKLHRSLWRFVLPPEYDPHNTRWTLKYETNLPGLVELMPQSRIYVCYGDLKYCQHVSKDCKSLARRLLSEVFNRIALSVCLTMSEKAQAPDNVGSNKRPELDEQAITVLLNFVLEHGLQCGWNTDLEPILSTLDTKIKEIRFKYGVMVKC